ncbi:MAG: polysaccharide deacetylase [Clostridia bacterium]|nr:polysaccharide deacetylase [Clostridia bacterium]
MLYGMKEVDIKQKINKKKVIIILVIAILVVIIFAKLGVSTAKKIKKIDNNPIQNSEINKENKIEQNIINTKPKTKHIAQINSTRVQNYTDLGRENIINIYNAQEKQAYITFDDGPSKSVTPLILDYLKQENIQATFFVLGNRAEKNPELIKREYEEGHFIANHGYSHVYGQIYSNPQAVLEEYNKTRDIIKNILGNNYEGHLFRFPGGSKGGKYGAIKEEAKVLLDQNDIAYIDWNALSEDSAGAKTKEALIENIKKTVGNKNVVIILMHDSADKILTYESLPDIINYLKEQGYTFKNFYDVIK